MIQETLPYTKERQAAVDGFLVGLRKVLLSAAGLHAECEARTIKVDTGEGWIEHQPTGELVYTIRVWR